MKKKGLIVVSIVIAVIAYEGVTAKLIYDLNTVLTNPIVQAEVARGKLPNGPHVFANLSPWPSLSIRSNPNQNVIIPKLMSIGDYVLKYLHDNPILEGISLGAGALALTYCGWNIRKDHKREKGVCT